MQEAIGVAGLVTFVFVYFYLEETKCVFISSLPAEFADMWLLGIRRLRKSRRKDSERWTKAARLLDSYS